MKKYTLFSFVFVLLLILLTSLNVKSASAWDSGCSSSGPYSTITGQACGTNTTTPTACAPGDLFSYVTGQPCSTTTSVSSSSTVSTPTFQIGSRGAAVIAFQKMLENAGYSIGKIDGIYGRMTSAAATSYYKSHPCPGGSGGSSTCGPLPIVPINPITPITSLSPITFTSPIGGTQWVQGTTQTISWTDSTPTTSSHTYDISYFDKSMVNTIIATGVSGSSYSWTIPNSFTTSYYVIKVCETGTTICNTSNTFNVVSGTITAPTPISTTPTSSVPVISSLSPTSGPTGTQATVNGSGFNYYSQVCFDNTNVAPTIGCSSFALPLYAGANSFTIPLILSIGSHTVQVCSTALGYSGPLSCSNNLTFNVTSATITTPTSGTTTVPLTITSLAPQQSSNGQASVGNTVMIYGTGFSSSDLLSLNGTLGASTYNNNTIVPTYISSTQMSFVVPSNVPTSGVYDLVVTNNNSLPSNEVSFSISGSITTTSTTNLTASLSETSPASQSVVGGTSNQPIADYTVLASGSGVTIQELDFSLVGNSLTTPITTVTVGNSSAVMTSSGTVMITGLNLSVAANNTGIGTSINIPVTANYAPVGINGVPAGQQFTLNLTGIKYYDSNSITHTATFSVASNQMTLVANGQ